MGLTMPVPARFAKWLGATERDAAPLSFNGYLELLNQFSYNGVQYTLPNAAQEEIDCAFTSYARSAYKANGVVFACMAVRMRLFSEARFTYRRLVNGRPGELFGTAALRTLEQPWPGATTGSLLKRMIQYADLGGNAYIVRRPGALRVLRPDWVTIIGEVDPQDANASVWDVDVDVKGYSYKPGGPGSGSPLEFFLADEVAHFAPIPDPEAKWRGMSWLTPIAREIMGDKALTEHKLSSLENGATPNLVVSLNVEDLDIYERWIEKYRLNHEGPENRGKTLFLGAGSDAKVVGSSFKELELKAVQGAGETRIAAAAGVPPIIVGLSEGLAAATYSNYGQARRAFSDLTMSELWREACGTLSQVVTVPGGAELWYDKRDIPFLQEDQKDAADIREADARTIRQLVDGGYDPASAVDAVMSDDFSRLQHSGLLSVQLQPPGTTAPAEPAAPPAKQNGNGRDDSYKMLVDLLRERQQRVRMPDVNVRFEEGAIQVAAPDAPNVTFADGAIRTEIAPPPPAQVSVQVDVPEAAAQEPPVVNVTVEREKKPRSKTIEFGDGRTATVTETEED